MDLLIFSICHPRWNLSPLHGNCWNQIVKDCHENLLPKDFITLIRCLKLSLTITSKSIVIGFTQGEVFQITPLVCHLFFCEVADWKYLTQVFLAIRIVGFENRSISYIHGSLISSSNLTKCIKGLVHWLLKKHQRDPHLSDARPHVNQRLICFCFSVTKSMQLIPS